MVDSERLILEIEKYPCIWDPYIQDYYNKILKDACWNHVCQAIIEDWDQFSNEYKNIKLADVKKRWNNIRDYFKKEIQIQNNPNDIRAKKKRKKYVFTSILKFLRPVFDQKFDSDNDEDDLVIEDLGLTISSAALKNQEKLTDIVEALDSKISLIQRPEDNDPDLMFLKSLLPDFKELTTNQKMDFKIGIMQLIRSIKGSNSKSLSHEHSSEPTASISIGNKIKEEVNHNEKYIDHQINDADVVQFSITDEAEQTQTICYVPRISESIKYENNSEEF